MIALGWCRGQSALPYGVIWQRMGPLTLVGAARADAPDARARLNLLLRCFQAEIELLPLAPAQEVSFHRALEMPVAPLCAALDRLEGRAQLSLLVESGQSAARSQGQGGRGWLRARQALHARDADLRTGIETLSAQIGLAATPVWRRADGSGCDVLVGRGAVALIRDRISELAEAHLPPSARMTLTGPWPPFSFAGLTLETVT